MTKQEVQEFIERMQEAGDDWTEQQVLDVYGNMTLEEATSTRLHELEVFSESYVKAVLASKK